MRSVVSGVLSLFWVVIGYLALCWVGRRFFTGRYRAEAAAAAVIVAFTLGVGWPRGTPDAAAVAPPPAPPTAPLPQAVMTDVAAACATAHLGGGTGKGNVDGAWVQSGAGETPAGPAPELRDGETLVIRGWATGPGLKAPAAAACVVVDGKLVAATKGSYGGSRPDVAAAFNSPALAATAFALLVPAAAISAGRHHIAAAAVAADGIAMVVPGGVALNVSR